MDTFITRRPDCLDRVPEGLEGFLENCPKSPNGVHRWLAKAVWRMHDRLTDEEQTRILYWATRNCGRRMQPGEIENTISNINRKRDGRLNGRFFKPLSHPVPEEINKIVFEGPRDLRSLTKIDASLSAHQWLLRLFPVDSLLCLAQEVVHCNPSDLQPYISRHWCTKRLQNWVSGHAALCDSSSLLVPVPASFIWHYAQDGHRSTRCNAMFPTPRLYLVIEFDFSVKSRDGKEETRWAALIRGWEQKGISTRQACSALIRHLSLYAPLVLIVWSAGKSLHTWFNVSTASEKEQHAFMDYSCAVGADPATWTKCQLVRLPMGIRGDNKVRQTVEYFDPSNLPGSVKHSR